MKHISEIHPNLEQKKINIKESACQNGRKYGTPGPHSNQVLLRSRRLRLQIARRIEEMGRQCSVIAPSLVPRKPGDRIKTDRRDAKKLLGHFAAGQVTEVYPHNGIALTKTG